MKEKRDGPFEMTGWTSLCRPSLSIGLIAIANAMHFKAEVYFNVFDSVEWC